MRTWGERAKKKQDRDRERERERQRERERERGRMRDEETQLHYGAGELGHKALQGASNQGTGVAVFASSMTCASTVVLLQHLEWKC